ncbi:hypothetical protein AALO_G00119220 [Alosa alosa]|uniref:Adenosine 5'-monophosphoramidase HINT3 n=1 Tax=Alosa alosa TaxID=278164 RepID=A0AAV6GUJ8_9TELE|nr:hypothetical protein AALO_G00119220 [Alosa alosa]
MTDQESNGDPKETFSNGDTCIFCRIASNNTDTEIVHCNDELVCFRDVKPGAPHHYLVIPREHVGNCKSLRKEHIQLESGELEGRKRVCGRVRVGWDAEERGVGWDAEERSRLGC